MELKELFDIQEKLESRINAYWTYWSVAIFAIGGWLFSGKQSLSQQQSLAIAIGVSAFFLANLGVLWPATRLVIGIRDEIRLRANECDFLSLKLSQAFTKNSLAFRLELTLILHIVVDLVLLWALFNL